MGPEPSTTVPDPFIRPRTPLSVPLTTDHSQAEAPPAGPAGDGGVAPGWRPGGSAGPRAGTRTRPVRTGTRDGRQTEPGSTGPVEEPSGRPPVRRPLQPADWSETGIERMTEAPVRPASVTMTSSTSVRREPCP